MPLWRLERFSEQPEKSKAFCTQRACQPRLLDKGKVKLLVIDRSIIFFLMARAAPPKMMRALPLSLKGNAQSHSISSSNPRQAELVHASPNPLCPR